jgi:hypothetical protein
MPYTGRDGMRAIANLLDQLAGDGAKVFGRVTLATRPPIFEPIDFPAVWVEPTAIGPSHHFRADHPASVDPLTSVHFRLNLYDLPAGEGLTELERADRLATLAELCLRALNGQGLGGALPALTHVEKGDLTPGKQGQDATMTGTFTMMDDPE